MSWLFVTLVLASSAIISRCWNLTIPKEIFATKICQDIAKHIQNQNPWKTWFGYILVSYFLGYCSIQCRIVFHHPFYSRVTFFKPLNSSTNDIDFSIYNTGCHPASSSGHGCPWGPCVCNRIIDLCGSHPRMISRSITPDGIDVLVNYRWNKS